MKQITHTENKSFNSDIDFDRLRHEFEGLPEPVRVRPIRVSRYQLRGGLPIDELERISAMRVWEPLAGIPVDPKFPDDFEPALPEVRGLGRVGE
ncbi:MAG: hypothetical protein ACE37H_07960 [Phycisphaeraceae bacterium]